MRGADALTKMLIEHGVEHIFGVPGDTTMAFHDSLRIHGNEIKHVLCRDERNAAYAADGYARVSGKTGVVEVPSGGGALYVVPGVSEANVSNIPFLCISSEISMSSEETNALTDCQQEDLFSAVTKWNRKIRMVSKIPHNVRKAFRMSGGGISGAVSLSFPENILRQEVDFSEGELYGPRYVGDHTPFRNEARTEDVKNVIDMILAASKPVILAGGGVHLSKAHDELEEFINNCNIPVATSIDGKGSIQEFSPYALGVVGANGGSEEAYQVVKEADLIIVLGSKLNNVTTMGKKILNDTVKVIQVDIGEEVIGNNVPVDLPVMCDIKAFLTEANELAAAEKENMVAKFASWNQWTQGKMAEKRERIEAEYKQEGELVVPARVFDALERLTDEETIFVADAGTPTPYLSSYVRLKKAGKQAIIPRGHGALGYALAAAIGAKVAKPNSTVISMFGDGSFGMALGDLETAKRIGLPIVFINFQNNAYGWIKTIQKLYYNENYFGVDFSSIDTVKIAEGFGLKGRNINSNEEIEEAIKWAIEQDESVLLNVKIEPPTEIVPPVYQWENDAKLDPTNRKKLVY